MHSGYYDRQSKLGDTAKYNYTNNYKYTGSSSIRASSQIRPVKSTNYGLVEPPSLNIYKSSTLGGASYLKSSYLPQVEPGKPKGLTNLRNTCYINSVLQILFDLLQLPSGGFGKPVTKVYSNLKQSYSYADYKEFKKEVQKRLSFVKGDDQQDAQEFLRSLLQVMNQQNKGEPKSKKSLQFQVNLKQSIRENWQIYCKEMRYHDDSHIVDVFGGETHIELRCMYGHMRYTFERYMDLSLSFPKERLNDINSFIKNYFKEQQIEGVECEQCKKKTRFTRKVSLYSLPNVLVLHLNRFQQGYYSNMKIRTEICFDEVITIPVTVLHPDIRNTPNKYRLSGVICHLGSMNAGHYYAIKKGKLARSNDWYICNDEIIKEANIRPTGNQSESAYILFYSRIQK